ncbi:MULTISPECIES: [protein-PII] uridylyltransferase [Desulfococcus]|uniref:Bifunctional uridylyltransferase/uridylyl-removing enzyme n=1 Tax=Desulfococcus multivorans DSM 2059 TaxID=1121405 RepID=S7V568_DESML|nr:[protein-PII] uridylyltransferase [Desulfococcus multivorans]AOY57075.1 GlnD1: [protein PII] uridylyltransferase [Desulfococcus multivorans]EPR41784.1 UTP-GlnB uridylyltransferase, GlnD / adenyl transferase, GlnE [Desulfococcus multivorans DSM 2059]SJZ88226.1 UTP--GlnB (protein PII) uridylyltransferase, GlnD [Desulfococcus multivorans DSM 2059]
MPESTSENRYVDASRTLQEKRREMVSRFFTGDADDFTAAYSRLLDDYFRESFENSMIGPRMGIDKNPYAIIALGGYGRREQCVHSDVDILFLFKKELPKKAEALIREIIYPLWDIGLDIGHAVRSLKDCMSLAARDFEVLMSLLDARFVCGMSPLYTEMADRLREKILFRRGRKIVDWLTARLRDRHRVFGNPACLSAPNLKEGRGGLRDYHALLWLSHVRFGLKHPRDLEYHGHLSHEEYQDLERSLAFVLRVRSGLHILVRRKYDRLHPDHQVELAERFGYRRDPRQHAVERFLGELHGNMGFIHQTCLGFVQETESAGKRFGLGQKAVKVGVAGIEIRRRGLVFGSVKTIMNQPENLLRVFEESVRLGLPLGRETRRLVREFRHLMDGERIRSHRVRRALEKVLIQPVSGGHDVLGALHATGMLSQLIPEMETVVNRVEYDTCHVYPLDRHLLETVVAVARLGAADAGTRESLEASVDTDLCRTLLEEEIDDRRPLVWAALFHDMGKGCPDRHHAEAGEAVARSALARLGYSREMIDTVAFLVRNHQRLPHTAMRRDIDSEETPRFLARLIGDIPRLNMLYLLSVADLKATGPTAWNAWTAALLRSLFLKAARRLLDGESVSVNAFDTSREKIRDVMAVLASSRDRSDAASLFSVMSSRYLLATPAFEIREHVALFRTLGEKPFVWKIDRRAVPDTRRVVVLGRDLPGFFSNIAGVLALNRIDVLDARIHTWRNNVVLAVFTVTPPPDPLFEDERWVRAARELLAVIRGNLDIGRILEDRASPPRAALPAAPPDSIHIDNADSGVFTIIEVHTRDGPGLLYRLTQALFRCGLDILSARIATRGDHVVDVFYVRDFDGRKIASAEATARVRSQIASVLSASAYETSSSDACRPPPISYNGEP